MFHGKLDESAAMAIALLAEESLVSSLLPLAKRHVERVRFLESQHSSNRNGDGKGNSLDTESKSNESLATDGTELILPPDGAIARLTHCQNMVMSPSAAAKSTASLRPIHISLHRNPLSSERYQLYLLHSMSKLWKRLVTLKNGVGIIISRKILFIKIWISSACLRGTRVPLL